MLFYLFCIFHVMFSKFRFSGGVEGGWGGGLGGWGLANPTCGRP